MIRDQSPLIQCLLGTGFTWFVTAAGAALVFVIKTTNQKLLDYSLGFGAGVMIAASFWSLLNPALKIAQEEIHLTQQMNFFLIVFGFLIGGLFVHLTDLLLPSITSKKIFQFTSTKKTVDSTLKTVHGNEKNFKLNSSVRSRLRRQQDKLHTPVGDSPMEEVKDFSDEQAKWRRLLLLIIAVTLHNFPEGMAVGVGFGSIPTSTNASLSFNHARNLAIGIGIQNFPEGLVISLPLRSFGMGSFQAFWYGQLSGVAEIIAGLLGVFFVQMTNCLLPFALAFAAGAMIFVVFNEIIPGITLSNRTTSSWCVMGGFTIMMILDVAFG